MGYRKNYVRGIMDERPRLSYGKIAEQIGVSQVTVARWMADEPTEEQYQRLVQAVKELRNA